MYFVKRKRIYISSGFHVDFSPDDILIYILRHPVYILIYNIHIYIFLKLLIFVIVLFYLSSLFLSVCISIYSYVILTLTTLHLHIYRSFLISLSHFFLLYLLISILISFLYLSLSLFLFLSHLCIHQFFSNQSNNSQGYIWNIPQIKLQFLHFINNFGNGIWKIRVQTKSN